MNDEQYLGKEEIRNATIIKYMKQGFTTFAKP